jgi:hypothetical protein
MSGELGTREVWCVRLFDERAPLNSFFAPIPPPTTRTEWYFDRTDVDCSALGYSSTTCANGWQAIDATPQETSVGGAFSPTTSEYRMGPAPVKLVKASKSLSYDSQVCFIFMLYKNVILRGSSTILFFFFFFFIIIADFIPSKP